MTRTNSKLHFVTEAGMLWPEFSLGMSAVRSISDEQLSQRCAGAFNNWIMQTAVLFARSGVQFTWGHALKSDSINLVSGIDFGIRRRDLRSFILAMRADGPYPHIANYVGQQNMIDLREGDTSFFPHWPQPGLIKRDSSREGLIENVSFKGDISNLAPSFRSESFIKSLNNRGINLQMDLRTTDWSAGMKMHDYQKVDVVLAVRNLTIRDYRVKPASKLVNAWLAGVPAILGPEPAFRELRRNDLDYLEVSSPEEAIAALDRLKDDRHLYRSMVENGHNRAKDFTQEKVIERWIHELNGPVNAAFVAWQKKSFFWKCLRYPVTGLLQKVSWYHASTVRQVGRRGPGSL